MDAIEKLIKKYTDLMNAAIDDKQRSVADKDSVLLFASNCKISMYSNIIQDLQSMGNVYTAKEIRKKLKEINPQVIENSKYTNPFLYQDVRKWYNELEKK